ncbi:uncharacterized protein LOC143546456 isoform X1 [Bidens hawaiensis]|uniref:uncharacterized protein LOC143546456 isoform X1 n=1 Tax=Bidens hawaiensis TaxID=980011 RepID=UPI00404B4F1D
MVPVARKKVESIAVARIESPRTKDEVLRRRNRKINNLSTPLKHKLLVLKETNRNEVHIRSEPKEIIIQKENLISSVNKRESTTRSRDIVPVCENETKRDPQITLEIVVAGTNAGSNIRKADSISNANTTETANRLLDIVPVCKNETKMDPQTTSEIVIAGTNVKIPYESNLSENKPKKAFYSSICEYETQPDPQITSEIVIPGTNARILNKSNTAENRILDKSNMSENKLKKTFYSSIQVVLTEQEKQLKEILIKDQLFLSTAEALFKLNIPVGFLHVEDNNHHDNETKLKLDCRYEILKRKARSQELSVHPYINPSVGDTSIKFLDELVKQLYKDLEGLRLYGRDTCNEYNEADYLQMLEKDIHNRYPDINSFWDFGWHITIFAFVEKDEFVSDVEQYTFSRLIDEFVDDLLSV